jgi:hypothetical protein
MKICGHCKKELSLDCFQKNRTAPDGLQNRCKACTKEASKACRARRGHLWLEKTNPWKDRPENRERKNRVTRERMARLKAENPEKCRQDRRRWQLSVKYGLTFELKEVLVKSQGGVCLICLSPIVAETCATDHCHEGDYIRGMLCKSCNSALGLFKDSPEILRNAANYLEESRKIAEEPTTEDFVIAIELVKEANEKRTQRISISQPSSITQGKFA